jgi:transaldolase
LIKLFLDTANIEDIKTYNDNLISGFTTNPSLVKKANINNYKEFITTVLGLCNSKPVSFEVLSNTPYRMGEQANEIFKLGENKVHIKIPVKNTSGTFSLTYDDLLDRIDRKMNLNVTAITTFSQVKEALTQLITNFYGGKHIISIFAGRIADCGYDPEIIVSQTKQFILENNISNIQVLWASTREVFNIYQAERSGADIITCTPDILNKYIKLRDKNLEDYSTETAQQFFHDAKETGLLI